MSIIKSWPLSNKIRLANFLLPQKNKSGSPLFDGISFLNNASLLSTNSRSYLEYNVFSTGSYEPHIATLMRSQVKPGDVIFDIGANIGIHSVTLSQCTGESGQVFAFEPIDFLRKSLEENIWLNNINNVIIQPYALAEENGEEKVFFDQKAANQGTFSLANKRTENNQTIVIKKGDDLVKDLSIEKLNLIKIDVEGFEYKVLKGLENTISTYRPRIIFEHDENYVKRIAGNNDDITSRIYEFFESKNYHLFLVEEHCLTEIQKRHNMPVWGNIFAIPLNLTD